ncbi:hypothetical protein ES707_13555 [subsurface metagenome]
MEGMLTALIILLVVGELITIGYLWWLHSRLNKVERKLDAL